MSDAPDVAYLLLLLILPLSALAARRLAVGSVLKMVLAWIAIFAVLIVAVGDWQRVAPAFRSVGDMLGVTDQMVSGDTVRIRKAADGHFWADVTINGHARRMLIDSGATTTALSAATAQASGMTLDDSGFDAIIDTANGTVIAKRATAASFDIGTIHAANLPVVVSSSFGETDVIGMNFLSRLRSWRVEGDTLVLVPKGQAIGTSPDTDGNLT